MSDLGVIRSTFQYALEHNGGGNLAVGGLGNDERGGGLDDLVGDNHATAYGQAVHEARIVGNGHLTVGNGPVEHVVIVGQYLAIVLGTSDTGT